MQLREVLAAATAPYFSMLKAWLWQGRIHDPFQEFMVQQQVRVWQSSLDAGMACAMTMWTVFCPAVVHGGCHWPQVWLSDLKP